MKLHFSGLGFGALEVIFVGFVGDMDHTMTDFNLIIILHLYK